MPNQQFKKTSFGPQFRRQMRSALAGAQVGETHAKRSDNTQTRTDKFMQNYNRAIASIIGYVLTYIIASIVASIIAYIIASIIASIISSIISHIKHKLISDKII